MSGKRTIWVCPMTSLSFRSEETFLAHLRKKQAMIEVALKAPSKFAKTIGQDNPEDES